MMAVIGVMAVTVVIGLTITAATVNGLGVTSSNKALVQSRAAAEAGVSVVVAGMSGAGSCPATFASSANPKYSATVEYLNAAGTPVSCTVASQVKITSTGTSQSLGVSGASSGDTSTVEAIYPYTPALTPGTVSSGAAIYLANGANFNNGGLITSSATVPAIQVKTGNLDCDNNTVITGSVVVVTGSISLKSCTVTQDAWAFGTTTFPPPGGTIGGILRASGSRPPSHPLARWNPTMPMPTVPVWTEFGYNRNDWMTSAGVLFDENIRPTTAGNCPLPQNNGANPIIFNALNCGGVSDSGDVTLSNDLVVVAKKFTFANSMNFRSSTAAVHRVWFITPDLVPAGNTATCSPGQGNFTIGNNLQIDAPIIAMLYTPCGISTGNGFTWRGQMYAGTISNWNNAVFGYIGVGLPGADLGAGTYTPGGSSGSPPVLGTLVSSRDLVG
ncbi:hypothetical protein [Cryobacterium mannosilyticum]|uniref:Uncharacterized protein n=1 Tax=Cryobacterium mannosilyticum TaxID=1259190 RepID=A0A4R8W9U7_9MICO|nr:hypothetical protein [Cryobacterium mannosilyticum]TFC04616.1 hypothetical protein E3O32_07830 [Cryobacterium mannosilyticum]